MNAFISYSHQDNQMLDFLHKHLAQLQRDKTITTWTDREILVGGKLDQTVSNALSDAGLFIALLSPDYLASTYCYDVEFKEAMERQVQGTLIIVPVVLEPCDWLHTPFAKFKALPKDGKAVSTWENKNTAFLDIIQGIRRLLSSEIDLPKAEGQSRQSSTIAASRNYRVQKDFDSLEKLEFAERTFHEVKDYLNRYVEEVLSVKNIKVRVLRNEEKQFEGLLVNRNKIATEAMLSVSLVSGNPGFSLHRSQELTISYSIGKNNGPSSRSFALSYDEYQLYWIHQSFYFSNQSQKKYEAKDIAETIWTEWLDSVGIL